MADLGPPVRVSPLIKFGRWSFLALGIVYGAAHQSRLSKKEAAFRVEDDKRKAIRNAKIAEEKKRASELEMKELEEMATAKKPATA